MIIFFIGSWLYVKRIGRLDLRPDFTFMKKATKTSFSFLIIIVATQIYDRSGVIILGIIRGDAETGLYAASERLIVTFSMALAMFRNVFLPALTKLSESNPKLVFRFIESTAFFLVLLLTPGIMILFVMSTPLIVFLFGPVFAESAPIMRILCWSLIFIALGHVYSSILIVVDQQKVLSWINIFVCLTFLILSPFMIHSFGYEGLAWMRLACSGLLFTALLVFIFLTKRHPLSFDRWFAPVAASVISTSIFFIFPDGTLWVRIPFLLIGYTLILILLGGFCMKDYIFLRKIFQRKN